MGSTLPFGSQRTVVPSTKTIKDSFLLFYLLSLMLINADYKFLYCDIGANGAGSDAGILNHTELKEYLETNQVGLPPPEPLPGDD